MNTQPHSTLTHVHIAPNGPSVGQELISVTMDDKTQSRVVVIDGTPARNISGEDFVHIVRHHALANPQLNVTATAFVK